MKPAANKTRAECMIDPEFRKQLRAGAPAALAKMGYDPHAEAEFKVVTMPADTFYLELPADPGPDFLSEGDLERVAAGCNLCDNYVGPGTYEDYVERERKAWRDYWQRQADRGNDAGVYILTGERPARPS